MENTFLVRSTRSGNIYSLLILIEREEGKYRICNLTKGHICPCKFDTYEEAVKDIEQYEKDGKNRILFRPDK
jgi:hypothetical protein